MAEVVFCEVRYSILWRGLQACPSVFFGRGRAIGICVSLSVLAGAALWERFLCLVLT